MSDLTWRNETRKLSDLVPWEHNPKRMTKKQADGLRASIEHFGFAVPFLVSHDGDIYDGHQRQTLMSAIKEYGPNATVDVRVSSRPLTDDERRELVVRLKQNQAGWDFDMLGNLYEREELLEWGFEPEELGMFQDDDKPEDPGAQIDKAEELREKWGVVIGQLWQLGDHRLICGDCTDAAVVNAVAFGDRIDLWATDPPYGVSYADKNKYLNAVAKGNSIQVPIEGDHLTLDEAADLWKRAFSIVFEIAKPGCVYYVHSPQGGDLMMMMMMLREAGWLLKPQIIWSKNNHVLGRSDYQLKHEPILYGWKEGSHFWCGSRSEMSVWQIDKPQNSDFHPTTKPVELAEKAIQNSSQSNEIVFDGFLGSGTTLIACERLGRRCRAVEISPAYCAVAIQRWVDMTGGEPVLLDSTQT